mgnify:CR=1 FL=1
MRRATSCGSAARERSSCLGGSFGSVCDDGLTCASLAWLARKEEYRRATCHDAFGAVTAMMYFVRVRVSEGAEPPLRASEGADSPFGVCEGAELPVFAGDDLEETLLFLRWRRCVWLFCASGSAFASWASTSVATTSEEYAYEYDESGSARLSVCVMVVRIGWERREE